MLLPLSHAVLLISSLMSPALSAPEASAPLRLAQTDPIKGIDTMGDKGRSGPDGWVQAPVSRDTAASGSDKASGETKPGPSSASALNNKPMNAGDDPGTPADPKGASPGNAPK
jgi:hypothetical protein